MNRVWIFEIEETNDETKERSFAPTEFLFFQKHPCLTILQKSSIMEYIKSFKSSPRRAHLATLNSMSNASAYEIILALQNSELFKEEAISSYRTQFLAFYWKNCKIDLKCEDRRVKLVYAKFRAAISLKDIAKAFIAVRNLLNTDVDTEVLQFVTGKEEITISTSDIATDELLAVQENYEKLIQEYFEKNQLTDQVSKDDYLR